MAPTDNTGASVGAAPVQATTTTTADVLHLLGDPCAVRITTGEQDIGLGRNQLQQIFTAMIISTIRRGTAILSHVVRARVRTGTGRNGHRSAAAAAAASAATGNRGRGLILLLLLLLLPMLNRRRRLPVVMVVGMNSTHR